MDEEAFRKIIDEFCTLDDAAIAVTKVNGNFKVRFAIIERKENELPPLGKIRLQRRYVK